MKKILYVLVSLFLIVACEKERIEPSTNETLVNYYEIKNDNPDDPVDAMRYAIYEKYQVPVFFNDTIAKVFVKISPAGDSVFRYETVDMNWRYYSNDKGVYKYDYTYYDNEADKLKALEIVRSYLEKASKPLRPFCVLATKIADKITIKTGMNTMGMWGETYEIGYRTLLLQSLDRHTTPAKIDEFTTLIRKMMISSKIKNFKREFEEFTSVSDEKWYSKTWDRKEPEGLGVVWDTTGLLARHNASGNFLRYERITLSAMRISYSYYERDYPLESPEAIESFRQSPRDKIGAFGFVGPNKNNSMDSYSMESEMGIFLDEVLNTTRVEFTRRWGNSPLVMRKYDIFYKIIKEQLDIDLDAEN